MLDFTKLLDKDYLFGPNPPDLTRSDWIFFWAGAVFALAGIIAKFFAIRAEKPSPKAMLYRRFFHLFSTVGVLVLLWVGARFENIPWLSIHAVVLGIFLVWLFWLIFIAKYSLGNFRHQQKIWEEAAIKRKYLKK